MLKFFVGLYWCFLSLMANPQFDTFMRIQENAQKIPEGLLRAVSNIESGRYINGSIVPWPWTINVEGKGYIFQTKQEAIKAVEKFQLRGCKSIDVGIMQVNLHYHPNAFRNLEEAFDPQINIAYGAKFLKQLFLQHKSWNLAIGHYHSAKPQHHNAYKQKVLNNWVKTSQNKKMPTPDLKKTVLEFDDLKDIESKLKRTSVNPKHEITPFASVKRVYYPLDTGAPARSVNIESERVSYPLENATSRQYYSLD